MCPTARILSSLVSIRASQTSTSFLFASYRWLSPSIMSNCVFLCMTFEFVSSQCSLSFVTATLSRQMTWWELLQRKELSLFKSHEIVASIVIIKSREQLQFLVCKLITLCYKNFLTCILKIYIFKEFHSAELKKNSATYTIKIFYLYKKICIQYKSIEIFNIIKSTAQFKFPEMLMTDRNNFINCFDPRRYFCALKVSSCRNASNG